jgi:uncharacterized protein
LHLVSKAECHAGHVTQSFTFIAAMWPHASRPAVNRSAFEWDVLKTRSNESKHGVSFDDATLVFRDKWASEQADDGDHKEERRRAIGSASHQILFVVYTARRNAIRIISARKATRHESESYWKNRLLHARS